MFHNRNQTYTTRQNRCPKINSNDKPAHHNCTLNDNGSLTEWLLQTYDVSKHEHSKSTATDLWLVMAGAQARDFADTCCHRQEIPASPSSH